MLSIIEPPPARSIEPEPPARKPKPPEPRPAETAPAPAEEPVEFEIILGRRQIASVLFVATVIVVVFSAISYVAGKSISPKKPATPAPIVAAAAVVANPAPARAPVAEAPAPVAEPPLFAEPKTGALYMQMGAVEKGVAVIFAEGLRKRHLDAFVAPGPNDHIFRVLVGPFADSDAYRRAKDTLDDIGLNTFAKRYQQ